MNAEIELRRRLVDAEREAKAWKIECERLLDTLGQCKSPLSIEYSEMRAAEGWRKVVGVFHVDTVRPGWRGVWDALRSAMTGVPARRIATAFRVSVYAQVPEGVPVRVWGHKLEERS